MEKKPTSSIMELATPISRRNMLVAIGMVTGGLALADISTSPTAQAGSRIYQDTKIEISGSTLFHFNSDYSAVVPWTAPTNATLKGIPEALSNSTVTATWDTRLLNLTTLSAVVANSDKIIVVPCSATVDGQSGTLSFGWPVAFSSGSSLQTYDCVLPFVTKQNAYPNDAVEGEAEPSKMTIDFVGHHSPLITVTAPDHKRVDGAAWGAALSVIWGPNDAGIDPAVASYAKVIRLQSVGPASLPAGSKVVLSVDADVVHGMAVESVLLEGDESIPIEVSMKESFEGKSRVIEVSLRGPVEAGRNIRINVAATVETTGEAVDTRPSALVAFHPPKNSVSMFQRQTLAESVALGA